MSDENTSATDENGGDEFTPITSQEALDKIIGQRIDRVKKQFSDYADLKTKAAKFDEVETSKKSEVQKLQEQLETVQKDLATERLTASRAKFAETKGVPASALTGDSEEAWEQQAADLLAWRGTKEPKPVKTGLKSGATNTDSRLDPKERAAAAMRQFRSS